MIEARGMYLVGFGRLVDRNILEPPRGVMVLSDRVAVISIKRRI